MGNYASCSFASPKLMSLRSARVILPGGEVRQFREPVKAAELMLDSPNFFVVDSRSLNIGRRFSPLTADEDLEFGSCYFMLPMKRVHSVMTPEDVAACLLAASSAPKRIHDGGSAKISPDTAPTQPADDRPGLSMERSLTEYTFRLSVSRSKRPGLDTISE